MVHNLKFPARAGEERSGKGEEEVEEHEERRR
jgi:hypothetical protein